MCRAIARDPIVLGKQGGKLSADNYVKAIYPGFIIRGQFSGWQLFGGNYQYSIILWGNSLSATCPRVNYPRAITREAIFRGAIIRGEIILGAIILRAIVQGEIIRGSIVPRAIIRGNYPRKQLSGVGGNYPGGNCVKQ